MFPVESLLHVWAKTWRQRFIMTLYYQKHTWELSLVISYMQKYNWAITKYQPRWILLLTSLPTLQESHEYRDPVLEFKLTDMLAEQQSGSEAKNQWSEEPRQPTWTSPFIVIFFFIINNCDPSVVMNARRRWASISSVNHLWAFL